MKTFLKFYNALGNNKGQRFRRFFSIVALIAALIAYGFKSDAIKISVNKIIAPAESSEK